MSLSLTRYGFNSHQDRWRINTSIVHTNSIQIMFPHNNEGRNQLLNDYTLDELQEIADHRCSDGVCFKHIHYVDTIAFFDKYEGEILDLIHIRYGVDTLVDIFKQSEACYDMYRNDCCWLFIENVATDYVIEMEDMEEKENMMIEEYMKPVDNYVNSLFNGELAGFNPPGSMNLNRYSHA